MTRPSTTLLGMGIDPTTAKIDQILKAIEKIQKADDAGQFRRFTGNDYSTDLTKGNIWVALAYSRRHRPAAEPTTRT